MLSRRQLLTGAGSLATYAALPRLAEALTPAQRAVVLSQPPFNPLSLFQNGKYAGFLYDWYVPPPATFGSGISPAYRDQANTIANADGNPVGLLIDRSQGVALGAPVLNEPFTYADTTALLAVWTAFGAGALVTKVAGQDAMRVENGGAANAYGYRAFSTVAGVLYRVIVNISAKGSNTPRIQVATFANGSDLFVTNVTSIGQYIIYFRAVGTTTYINFPTNSTTIGHYIEVSGPLTVEPISGNHGLQVTAAAKPTLKLTNGIWRTDYDGGDYEATSLVPASEMTMAACVSSNVASWIIAARDAASTTMTTIGVDASGYPRAQFGDTLITLSAIGSVAATGVVLLLRGKNGVRELRANNYATSSTSGSFSVPTTLRLTLGAINVDGGISPFLTGSIYRAFAIQRYIPDSAVVPLMRYLGRGIVSF